MTTAEVKQLQDKLVKEGYMSQAEVDTGYGIFGPKTTAALNAAEAGSQPKYKSSQKSNVSPYSESDYTQAVNNHPLIQQYIKQGNTAEDLEYASSTGDYSGIVNQYGQPFSLKEQQAALKQAEKDTAAYFEAQKAKETADTEAALAQKQADFKNYLLTSGQDFEADKATLDQSAANQGVLFSGGRAQKESSLQNRYSTDQAYKRESLGRDISSTARDYQYKYGNDAASGLSDYFKLGGNTYNANVAQGGVGSSSLSKIYKPSTYDFGGTEVAKQKASAQKRAAGLLWNKGNKLLSTGYANQY